MGSLFSGFLTAASLKSGGSFDVLLRANWKEHREEIKRNGLRVHPCSKETETIWNQIERDVGIAGNEKEAIVKVNAIDDSIFDVNSSRHRVVDSVLLLDKSCYTEQCAHMIKNVLAANGSCLTLQNGMGNVDILQRVLGENRVLQGSTSQAAMINQPGSVEHTGIGYIKIATPSETVKPAAMWWVKTLLSVGLAATPAGSDFERVLWEKLIINSAINPLTSLYGVKNGELRNSEAMKSLMKDIVQEGVAVAKAIGVNLSVEDMYEKTLLVCTQTANNNSSMYSDILRKRSTEVDFINGYIARTGEKQHVLVPINRCITKMIKAKEDLIQQ